MDLKRFCELVPEELKRKPIWTVSIENNDGKMKCVADIHSGGDTAETFTGFRRGRCDYANDYDTLEYVITKCVRVGYEITNLRMYRPFVVSGGMYAVLDIEASATEETRKMFEGLPQIFSEVSMSGKGVHVFFPLMSGFACNDPIWSKVYCECVSLKSDDNTWEILLSQDVTFTGNIIEGNKNVFSDVSIFSDSVKYYADKEYAKNISNAHGSHYDGGVYDMINEMATAWIKGHKVTKTGITDWDEVEPKSEAYKELVEMYTENADQHEHFKTIAESIWNGAADRSRALYKIGMIIYKDIRPDIAFRNSNDGAELTLDDAAWILFKILMDVVYPLREDGKYDTKRKGVPILLDEARKFVDVAETRITGGFEIDDDGGNDDE